MKESVLVILIFASALAWWIPRQWEWREAQRALFDSEARLAALRNRVAGAETALNSARQEQGAQNRAHSQAAAALNAVRHDLSTRAPESQWVAPPSSLPKWELQSPYVWVRKDFLRQLNLPVFAKDGAITRDAGELLGLDRITQETINAQVQSALSNYHSFALLNAEISNSPPVSGQGEGQTVTVQIPATPEEGGALTEQITAILQENLGAQRAQLVTNTAAAWLNGFSSTQAMTVSVTRKPDGNYQLEMQLPDGSSSTFGGVSASYAQQLVPDYVLPLLADAFPQAANAPDSP
jgi:hypothetical protein